MSRSTCFWSLITAALAEAVGVSERMQGGNRWQIWTQTEQPTQQPQSDQWTGPPQNLHGSLLTAALQTRTIHLKDVGKVVRTDSTLRHHEERSSSTMFFSAELIGDNERTFIPASLLFLIHLGLTDKMMSPTRVRPS